MKIQAFNLGTSGFHSKNGEQIHKKQKGGWIKDVSLEIFLQILGSEKRTCVLEVKGQHVSGNIWLSEGELYSATAPDNLKGEDALFHMLAADKVDITFYEDENNYKEKIEKTIDCSLIKLILEAARRKNDQNLSNGELSYREIEQARPQQKAELDTIQIHFENVKCKLKRYCKNSFKFGKIIDSMITDINGNILKASNNSIGKSEIFKSLITAVLEIANLSSQTYNISSDDYICLIDSNSSLLVSPIDTNQFFIVVFEN